MTCDESCRCYADYNTPYPHRDQTCGIRKRGYIIPCDKTECCSGGCPTQYNDMHPRQPYSFGYLYPLRIDNLFKFMALIVIILLVFSTYLSFKKRT